MSASSNKMNTAMRGFLVVLLIAGASPAASRRCHPDDKAALVAIIAAFGDTSYLSGWARSGYPCCDWYGVDCDRSSGRVVGLFVSQDANLTGTIPDAIAGLAHLKILMWHHLPGLSGTIPPAIAKLVNLEQLIITWTAVSGPVPPFLAALTNLVGINLSFNSLTGTIPALLGAIPNLLDINLSRNRLAGAIPRQLVLSKSAGKIYLDLSHNNLSGVIPDEFAAASNFAMLDLSRNAFTGDASGLFGRGKELQSLDLSRNAFSFNLSAVELPEKLTRLDVSHSAIYGGIPAQVSNLTSLRSFNVSYNRLCGAVPTGGSMATFDAYSYQHNKCLCGAPLTNPCK